MKTNQLSMSESCCDGDAHPTAIDRSMLATVQGGMIIPVGGGGGGSTPRIPLGGIGNLGPGTGKSAPRCQNWRTWNSPQGTAITGGGGLVRFPLLSCPQLNVKRPAVPKPHL